MVWRAFWPMKRDIFVTVQPTVFFVVVSANLSKHEPLKIIQVGFPTPPNCLRSIFGDRSSYSVMSPPSFWSLACWYSISIKEVRNYQIHTRDSREANLSYIHPTPNVGWGISSTSKELQLRSKTMQCHGPNKYWLGENQPELWNKQLFTWKSTGFRRSMSLNVDSHVTNPRSVSARPINGLCCYESDQLENRTPSNKRCTTSP